MSFASPLALLCLLVLPVLVGWYLWQQSARRRAAEAFASERVRPSAVPHGPGWRRHAPMLAILVALGSLGVAAARPRIVRSVPVGRLSIMLATDVSGSMLATDVAPNRVTAAQRAADTFVTHVPSQVSVGVMEFNQTPTVLALPTRDRLAAINALGRLQTGGGTAIGNAIQQALTLLGGIHAPAGRGPSGAIILLSDGKSTSGSDPVVAAREARRRNIPVFTVALGTATGTITVPRARGTGGVVHKVPPDPQSLAQIAQAAGGRTFTAADAGRLSDVYKQLGSQLGHTRERREVTGYFAGAALLLLVLGSALTLHWFGRII